MPDREEKEYASSCCKFASRCAYATPACRSGRPDMVLLSGDRRVKCMHPIAND